MQGAFVFSQASFLARTSCECQQADNEQSNLYSEVIPLRLREITKTQKTPGTKLRLHVYSEGLKSACAPLIPEEVMAANVFPLKVGKEPRYLDFCVQRAAGGG